MKTILSRLLGLVSLACWASAYPVLKQTKLSLYDEALPMLYASTLVYEVANVVQEARTRNMDLEVPQGFPLDEEALRTFADRSIDFRGANGRYGLSFEQIASLLKANENIIRLGEPELATAIFNTISAAEAADMGNDRVFLETFRCFQRDVSCVYGVVRDRVHKQIIITFRGSQLEGRDWRTNFNARLADLRTPALIKNKLDSELKDHLKVHEGYYNYLFDNQRIDGDQKFDEIVGTLEELLQEEKDYSVYVTGHSLGAALASLFAFKLAGKSAEWLPRPVTCISYASPRWGTANLRIAHEQMEQDRLLRNLRINNAEDFVPAGVVMSLFTMPSRRRLFKHVGINLRLKDDGYDTIHTSRLSGRKGFRNSVQNSIFKPIWEGLKYHGLPLHAERLDKIKGELSELSIDGLYEDESVVGEKFKIAP